MSKVAVLARIPLQPGKKEEAKAALEEAVAGSADETGCQYYILHEDREQDDVLWMYELYADQAAFDAHPNTENYKALVAKIGGMLTGRPELTVLDAVAGKGL